MQRVDGPVLAMDVLQELRALDADGTFVAELVESFRSDSRQKLEALAARLRDGDDAAVAPIAHSLSGVARTLGAERAGRAAKDLETAASTQGVEDKGRLLEVLADEIAVALEALDRFVRE